MIVDKIRFDIHNTSLNVIGYIIYVKSENNKRVYFKKARKRDFMIKEAILEEAKIKLIVVCEDNANSGAIDKKLLYEIAKYNCIYVDEKVFNNITDVQNPQGILAVLEKENGEDKILYDEDIIVVLDGIQDPGNLGTIIRIADWFGIRHILCSKTTVDVYNSKTVQSTMGALARVEVHYVDLPQILGVFKDSNFPIYGTFLDGNSIYNAELLNCGVIVMGNEGNGISKEVANFVSHKLLIPSYPANEATSESLNVAVATAIVCSEFRRR